MIGTATGPSDRVEDRYWTRGIMKRTSLIVVALLSVTLVCAAEDPLAKIRTDFDRAAQAVAAGDPEVILDSTYPGLVQQVGGREAMQSMLAKNLSDLEQRGMAVVSTEIVSISQPLRAGDELHAIVRAKRTVKVPGGRQIQDTFVIAVSADEGKKWTFVDGPQLTPKHIEALFPDFNEALELPVIRPPVFEEDS